MKKPIVGTDWRTDCIDNGNSIRVCRTTGQSFRAGSCYMRSENKPQNR